MKMVETEEKKQLALATYWETLSKQITEKDVQLSMKEIGQIKCFLKITGYVSRTLMKYACLNWAEFTKRVMTTSQIQTCPSVPHIGYLLKHRMIAAEMAVEANFVTQDEVDVAFESAPYTGPEGQL